MEKTPNKFIVQGKIRKSAGDVTFPENSGLRLIINPIDMAANLQHDINQILTKKWKKSRDEAKAWFANRVGFKLGEIQQVAVQSDVWVVNALVFGPAGVDQDSLDKAMKKVAALALYEKASVHISDKMLSIDNFESIAKTHFLEKGVNVYVYSGTANKKA